MPPYWDNKALPTPTLTLPDTLFSTFWLFPSFLLKINAFLMRYEIWKGRKKVQQKAASNSARPCQNACVLPSTPLKLMYNYRLFFAFANKMGYLRLVYIDTPLRDSSLRCIDTMRCNVAYCLMHRLHPKYIYIYIFFFSCPPWLESQMSPMLSSI